jgi:AcrR family transcriptional regulator
MPASSATAPRKVGQRLGRTTGSVTYCFSSKEEMFKSVANSLFDELDETLDKVQKKLIFRRSSTT